MRVGSLLILFCLGTSLAQAQSFSEKDLVSLLENNPTTKKPVTSIEELLPLLPYELRENFTFVYNSRSPFASSISPEFPRTILFTKDTRLIITFTGDPEKPGYNFLEYMWFDNATSSFKMSSKDLNFSKKFKRHMASTPVNCTSCHGNDPRPINDSYPLWPGFYGSVRDAFPTELAATRKELEDYKKFREGEAKKGVYKHLIYSTDSSVSPYQDPNYFDSKKVVGELDAFKFLPNTRFGMALTELNRKRIYRKLSQSPHFVKNEKKFLKELLDCGKSQITKKDVDRIKNFIETENKDRLKRLGMVAADTVNPNNDMQEIKFARSIAQIDWIAHQSNVPRSDWSMALEENSLAFFDGILSGIHQGKDFYIKEDLIFEILKSLAAKDSQFVPYFEPTGNYSVYGYPFGTRLNFDKALKSCKLLK